MTAKTAKPKTVEEHIAGVLLDLTCATFKPGRPIDEISKELQGILKGTAPYFKFQLNDKHPSSFVLLTQSSHGMGDQVCYFFFDYNGLKIVVPDPYDTSARKTLVDEKFANSELFLDVSRFEGSLKATLLKMAKEAYK